MSSKSTSTPSVIFEQMRIIQEEGSVNMIDMSGIIRAAHDQHLYELVLYLSDIKIGNNSSVKYMDFLQEFGESLSD